MSRAPHEEGTTSFGRFARIMDVAPSYITDLKGQGRLVLTDDGKRIRIRESIDRIKATADPAKEAVTARHAANREARAGDGASAPPIAPPARDHGDDAADPAPTSSGYTYWRERTEKAKALAAERDNALADGKLLAAGDVTAAVAAAITTLRTRIESMPDVLGPQLAAIHDEAESRAVLAEAFEHALEEMARQFSNLAKVQA